MRRFIELQDRIALYGKPWSCGRKTDDIWFPYVRQSGVIDNNVVMRVPVIRDEGTSDGALRRPYARVFQ
jgi:hypothetical protein